METTLRLTVDGEIGSTMLKLGEIVGNKVIDRRDLMRDIQPVDVIDASFLTQVLWSASSLPALPSPRLHGWDREKGAFM